MDDKELVIQARHGSQDAYREIVSRYQNPLFHLVLRMVRDRSTAEDLVQESFLKAFRALDSFDPDRKLSSWLFKIAHNTTIDRLRRSSLSTVPLEANEKDELGPVDRAVDDSVPNPERQTIAGRLGRDLDDAIHSLSPRYRELVALRFQQGLAYDEIAQVLDLPIGTVKTRIHRGRKQMMDKMVALGWSPRGPQGRARSSETDRGMAS